VTLHPFKDHFSKQAAEYAKFRPRYPAAMFKYLGEIAPERRLTWDCATGNGQAAVELGKVFDRVIATDASEKQIANAEPHERVDYWVAPAEDSGLDSQSVDLVLVAQALHWFDLDRFYAELNRVLKPDGVFAASAYRFFRITPEIDQIVNRRYYQEIVGPYWPAERASIEKFEEIPFPFSEIKTQPFEMTLQWNLQHLVGYLSTWSATQRFVAANKRDPLEEISDELETAWGSDVSQRRNVVWPLMLRVGVKAA
jgi:ubiquinone/menaquinone biosynthesis C-methylase UbiE